jgi:alkaline phosphatase D
MSRILEHRYAISRRRLIQSFGALAAMPLLGREALAQPIFTTYPFQLGVASGDPAPDGFVIWTRLAPEPLEVGYGMPSQPVEVQWEVASDGGFRTIVQKGTAVARPELGHSVHVEVAGLEPARPYWYRFLAGKERSLTGRARTMPAPGANLARVRFASAGCQH